jgi:prepilin-type N-terminal cleavage/methylation domain-containing protein
MRTIWRCHRGFTLAELLVALAILALVLTGIVGIQQGALQAYVTGSNRVETQQNARVALERMGRDLREAKAITAANTTTITYTPPDPPLPAVPPSPNVTYALNGMNLQRTVAGGAAEVLVGGMQSLTFVYRDGGEATLAVPVGVLSNIRRIDITVQTRTEENAPAGGVADVRTHIASSVRLRNL